MIRSQYLLATLFATATFAAHAAETSYTFDSVTRIQQRASTTSITGILASDGTLATVSFPLGGTNLWERCEQWYGIMVSQPGSHTLTITTDVIYVDSPGGGAPVPVTTFVGCSLEPKP